MFCTVLMYLHFSFDVAMRRYGSLNCLLCMSETERIGKSKVIRKGKHFIKPFNMSRPVGKPTKWFLNRSDTNRPVQSQKMARGWKFWIKKVEELYYPVAKTKALISFAVTAKLICAFVFAYADCWFSHVAAHIIYYMAGQVTHQTICLK